jgi:DNA adenine methylase
MAGGYNATVTSSEPRPFLKWAGGKRQLLPELRRFYPVRIPCYFEPFLGSGAVFFDLWGSGQLRDSRVVLSDENADLIGCYLRLRDQTDAVLEVLEALAAGHARGGRRHYYSIRDDRFNSERRRWRARGGAAEDYPPELAAILIYLNRTGYNGLFRVNGAGDFNVPAGSYERPRIVDAERLRAAAAVLADPSVAIRHAPFQRIEQDAGANDFVYFDPPYEPLTRTAAFRSYTARGFTASDQERLQSLIITLAGRGVRVMLSNSTAPAIGALYETSDDVSRAGLRAYRVPARRAINSNPARRGRIDELLVTNVTERRSLSAIASAKADA